jgi:hypothetical protein
MAEPRSLSVKELVPAAQKAVAQVVTGDRQQLLPPRPPYIFGFFPPWLCGFVVRAPNLERLNFAEAQKIAEGVHKGIAASVGAARDATPAAILHGGITTIGFVPPIDTIIHHE